MKWCIQIQSVVCPFGCYGIGLFMTIVISPISIVNYQYDTFVLLQILMGKASGQYIFLNCPYFMYSRTSLWLAGADVIDLNEVMHKLTTIFIMLHIISTFWTHWTWKDRIGAELHGDFEYEYLSRNSLSTYPSEGVTVPWIPGQSHISGQ